MKILEITGEPILHGGQEKYIENLLKNIDYSGLSIDVLTPYFRENDSFRESVESHNGHVYELNLDFMPGKSRRLIYIPIRSFLNKNHYDVVHIHSGSISVLAYASLAAKLSGIKKIIVHSHSTGIPSIKHHLIRFIFGFVLSFCATDFLACSLEAGETKYSRSIVKNRLKIVKNGIPIEDFRMDNEKRIKKRHQLGIPIDSFVIGHVGRFSREKNHSFIIDLFSKVHLYQPDSFLLLVGDGELFDSIKEKVKALGLTDSVIFVGNADDVSDYYRVMDIFILPSIYEGLGLVAIEAQAAGLPCVLSTEVPDSAVIGRSVKRLELSDMQSWVDTCLASQNIKQIENIGAIIERGYDIKDSSEIIRKLYFN